MERDPRAVILDSVDASTADGVAAERGADAVAVAGAAVVAFVRELRVSLR